MFTLFTITELQEATLGAHMLLAENQRLHWPGSELKEQYKKGKRDVDDLTVTLAPMEIRTFLAKVTYN